MRLQGKSVLVTAAGQGIGKASVLAMAAQGAQVLATDVNPALLAAYTGVANVHTAVLDVMDKAAIQRVVAGLPRIDVLFNCAGFVHNGSILQATDDDWDFAFNLNVRSQFWAIQAVLPGMVARGHGHVCIIGSTAGRNTFVGGTCYTGTKHFVMGFAESLMLEVRDAGVGVSVIRPSSTTAPTSACSSSARRSETSFSSPRPSIGLPMASTTRPR